MTLSMTISIFTQQVASLTDIPFNPGMNVQQALEAAYSATPSSTVQFSVEYYGSMGYELTELDSISSQGGGDSYLFWELFVNGQPSQQGIDETTLSDGDAIGWNYTIYSSATHAGTRHEQIRNQRTSR